MEGDAVSRDLEILESMKRMEDFLKRIADALERIAGHAAQKNQSTH
jgi:hypothetical protein